MADRMLPRIASRHRRALEASLFMLGAGWHLGNDLPAVLSARDTYLSFPVALVAWVATMVIIVVIGSRLWTVATPLPEANLLGLAVLVLGAAVVAVCPAGSVVSMANWAFGGVGWVLLLVLARSPRYAIAMVLVSAATTLVAVVLRGDLAALPSFIVSGYAICALQLAVAVGARAVTGNVATSVAQARRADELETRRRCAEQAIVDRRRRYRNVRLTTEPLLAGLVDASLSPDDPQVRARCAAEAVRLRRLCVEGENVVSRLLRDLYWIVDLAADRGVRVDLDSSGDIGELPDAAREALVEPVAAAVARARTSVRLTVLATRSRVTVAGQSDGPFVGQDAVADGVELISDGTQERHWWAATWTRPSGSSSSTTIPWSGQASVPG